MKTVTLFAVFAIALTGCAQPVRPIQPANHLYDKSLSAQIVQCNAQLRDWYFNAQVILIAGEECLAQPSPNFPSCILTAETMNYIMETGLSDRVMECARAGRLETSLAAEALPVIEKSGAIAGRLRTKF